MRTHIGRSFKAVQRIGYKSELVTRLKARIAELEAENRGLLWALVISTNPPDVTITDDTYRKAKKLARDMAEFVYEGRYEVQP